MLPIVPTKAERKKESICERILRIQGFFYHSMLCFGRNRWRPLSIVGQILHWWLNLCVPQGRSQLFGPQNCPNWRYRSPNLVWNMAPFSTLTFYLFIFPPVSLYIHFMHERENCYGLSQVVYFFHYLYLFFFSYCSRMVKLPCIWLRLLATPTLLLPWFSTALTSQPKTM